MNENEYLQKLLRTISSTNDIIEATIISLAKGEYEVVICPLLKTSLELNEIKNDILSRLCKIGLGVEQS